MLVLILATAGGLALLAYAAEQFVIGAARIALTMRISAVVVGALLLGVGTSTPEILVSGSAAASGHLDIAVGNIVGSNIANLSLVLGIAALVRPFGVTSGVLKREAPIAAAAVIAFAIAIQGGLTRPGSGLLLVAMVVVVVVLIRYGGRPYPELESEVGEFTDVAHRHPLRIEIPRALLGLAGTLAGAQLLIFGAVGIAEEIGIEEGFIGLTLVAIGTSLPELVTCIQAARMREGDLVAGNLLGSNIANSFVVGGVVGIAGPGVVADPHLTGIATVMMIVVGLIGWILIGTGRRVVRWEGAVLLVLYAFILVLGAI